MPPGIESKYWAKMDWVINCFAWTATLPCRRRGQKLRITSIGFLRRRISDSEKLPYAGSEIPPTVETVWELKLISF